MNIQTIIEIVIILALAIAGGAFGTLKIYELSQLPKDEALSKLAEWLLYAVIEAEKLYGGGTGAIKLRYVYDLALQRFPNVVKYISFEQFSSLVDTALEKMKEMLKTNAKVEAYVENVAE